MHQLNKTRPPQIQSNQHPRISLYLAQFSNADIKTAACSSIQFNAYKSNNSSIGNVKAKKILVASGHKLQYVGCNFSEENFCISSSELMVGVFNKKTGRMKLLNVDLFHLKPNRKRSCSLNNTPKKSSISQAQELNLEFGSKKTQRAISSKLKYQSQNNEANKLQLESFSKTVLIPETQISELVPSNKTAVSVDQVYNINDIISEEDLLALTEPAECLASVTHEEIQTYKIEKTFSPFAIHVLETASMQLSVDSAKLLCYFEYMISMLNKSFADWKKKDPLPNVPEPFKGSLLNKFVKQRTFSRLSKDKVISEAIVLALKICSYCVDSSIIASSTKVSVTRLTLIAYTLGCHVTTKMGSKIFELKLPLYKYEPRFKRNK